MAARSFRHLAARSFRHCVCELRVPVENGGRCHIFSTPHAHQPTYGDATGFLQTKKNPSKITTLTFELWCQHGPEQTSVFSATRGQCLNHCTARGASSSVLRLDFSPEKSSGEPGVTRVLQSIDRSVCWPVQSEDQEDDDGDAGREKDLYSKARLQISAEHWLGDCMGWLVGWLVGPRGASVLQGPSARVD